MIVFLVGSFLLLVLSLLLVLRPLFRGASPVAETQAAASEQQALTLQILRDQQHELEQERALGQMSEAAYTQAHAELQRRVLEELGDAESGRAAVASASGAGRTWPKLAVVLALGMTALASLGYVAWGNPRALQPGATEPQQVTPEKILQMVNRLAARLKDNPDDLEGWLKLAQSYKMLGRYPEAADAFAKAESKVRTDAGLLASYAETLGMVSDKGLQGKPTALLQAALKLNPQEPNALLLAGAAAMERRDFTAAVTYWEQLLPMVEPGSEIDQALRDSIERIRQQEGGKAAKGSQGASR